MGLVINTGLTTQDGGLVASGAYTQFTTTFPANEWSYCVEIYIYRNQQALNDGYARLNVVEIPNLYFKKELTQQEFLELTPLTINQAVKEYLEQFVGQGNVEIVL